MNAKELGKIVRGMFPGVKFKVSEQGVFEPRFDITWSGNIPPSNAEVADALLAQNIPAAPYNTAWSKKARHCVVVVTVADKEFDLGYVFGLEGDKWTRRPVTDADYAESGVKLSKRKLTSEEKKRDEEIYARRAAHIAAPRLWR
jgi:hypothetical protein